MAPAATAGWSGPRGLRERSRPPVRSWPSSTITFRPGSESVRFRAAAMPAIPACTQAWMGADIGERAGSSRRAGRDVAMLLSGTAFGLVRAKKGRARKSPLPKCSSKSLAPYNRTPTMTTSAASASSAACSALPAAAWDARPRNRSRAAQPQVLSRAMAVQKGPCRTRGGHK